MIITTTTIVEGGRYGSTWVLLMLKVLSVPIFLKTFSGA